MTEIQKIIDVARSTGCSEDMWLCGYALMYGEFTSSDGVYHKCRKNISKALEWIEKAAKAGCTGAMIELGCYYSSLKPCTRDNLLRSLYWEELAWKNGEAPVAQNIAITYMKLKQPQECHAWLKRGYKKCRWPVALSLAKTYICGYGTKRDIDKARIILERIVDPSENSYPSDVRKARRYLKEIEQGRLRGLSPSRAFAILSLPFREISAVIKG